MTFRLTKHHGLGNDFLVFLTDDPAAFAHEAWAARAERWCDRHAGIGADGLLLGLHGQNGSDLVMKLHNADGSVAEMSGNGICCLTHAEVRRRRETEGSLLVTTDAGPRSVTFGPDPGGNPQAMSASIAMGAAAPGPLPDRALDISPDASVAELQAVALDAIDRQSFDLGNPHLVLRVADPSAVDAAAAGRLHEAMFDAGINVHFVAPTSGEPDAIDLVVWERGAGLTAACGSGATAAARAAHDWMLVGDRVTVHMPGGDVVVEVGESMTLHSSSVHIADVEVTV
ncbi:MAG: diaminopimelate epimerase [Aquihabitans sp.]